MLTVRGEETAGIVGLEMGADDRIAKPFSPRELLAGIHAVLRRAQRPRSAQGLLTRDPLLDLTQGRNAAPFDYGIDIQVSRLQRLPGFSP